VVTSNTIASSVHNVPSLDTTSDYSNPDCYINRELSQLEFHRRVLAQADDPDLPLLERLRFICVSGSVLDEFFEIRVAGLKHQEEFGSVQSGPDGMSPGEQMRHIQDVAHRLVEQQYRLLNGLFPLLKDAGIRFSAESEWNERQRSWLSRFFHRELLPIMSPLALDPAHPFPSILNKSLAFMVTLEGKDVFGRSSGKAVVQAPRALARVIRLPEAYATCPYDFVLLTTIIQAHVTEFFPGMKVTGCFPFRVTRDSDLLVDTEEVGDLRRALEGELSARRYGDAVRLEVDKDCPEDIIDFLSAQYGLSSGDIYRCDGPVNLMRLSTVPDDVERPDLKYPGFVPGIPVALKNNPDIFAAVREGDVLLHHPYESFAPVIEFVRQASVDPSVMAIRQTLYRTGSDSAIVQALLAAAHAGKEVLVVIELRARFDEEANIELANVLQKAGAKVVYGVVGLKTHAKMCMVVRREGRTFKRYVHLGTGNYHARTSRLYTDYGLFTCDPEVGEDVQKVFSQLTALGRHGRLKKILQSPFTLHSTMLALIEREIQVSTSGQGSGRIFLKMNSLVETQAIQALYRASAAGVEVRLLIRGICCLRPGVPGVSENIEVRSVVGRFLEHTRVFWFGNGGEDRLFMSSADWMGRNFFSRVEVCFPIENPSLRKRVIDELNDVYWHDTSLSWQLEPDGSYRKISADSEAVSAQSLLLAAISGE